MSWNIKQIRAFRSIRSGVVIARVGKRKLRFMTLTTSDVEKDSVDYGNGSLNCHFQILKQRFKRVTPYKLYQWGYLRYSDLSYYYNHLNIFKPLTFEYFKVETNEGNGVLHILFRGSYLPYCFVSNSWMDIHNSWDVNISLVRDGDSANKVGSYAVNQYISFQGSSYVRSSQSWDWVYRGYTGLMEDFRRWYPCTYKELWDTYLENYALGRYLVTLDDFG